MFRSRFTEAFPKSLAHFGPQELERGVVDTVPGESVEHLLCALLGLLLNRKQDVKYAFYMSPNSSKGWNDLRYLKANISAKDQDITIARWKRLYRRIKHNGRRTGQAKILCLEVLHLPR